MIYLEDEELDMIDSILPDVVFDAIAAGDRELFLEALGADGLYSVAGNGDNLLQALREAVACKDASHVGVMVIEYITSYYSSVCYDDIKEDLEDYTDKYAYNDE